MYDVAPVTPVHERLIWELLTGEADKPVGTSGAVVALTAGMLISERPLLLFERI
jgi:hypothetical protein